jgi:hypothetical protein
MIILRNTSRYLPQRLLPGRRFKVLVSSGCSRQCQSSTFEACECHLPSEGRVTIVAPRLFVRLQASVRLRRQTVPSHLRGSFPHLAPRWLPAAGSASSHLSAGPPSWKKRRKQNIEASCCTSLHLQRAPLAADSQHVCPFRPSPSEAGREARSVESRRTCHLIG